MSSFCPTLDIERYIYKNYNHCITNAIKDILALPRVDMLMLDNYGIVAVLGLTMSVSWVYKECRGHSLSNLKEVMTMPVVWWWGTSPPWRTGFELTLDTPKNAFHITFRTINDDSPVFSNFTIVEVPFHEHASMKMTKLLYV